MKCPYCNTDMIHGYLNTGMTIWSERNHKISLLPDGNEMYALRLKQPCFPLIKLIIFRFKDATM